MTTKINRETDVTFTITTEPCDIPVRGNALACGDDNADRECENNILARLEAGDVNAWCTIVVTATHDDSGIEVTETLGACSISENDTAEQYVTAQGMQDEAFARLLEAIAEAEAECSPKQRALAAHLGVVATTIDEAYPGSDDTFECETEPGEYRVLDASERETAADAALEDYIDACILPEIPEAYRSYFNSAAWKRDALLSDGYGHTLASYDGAEEEEKIDGVWYYIYRVN